ncbi:hypothetical protein EVJ58_g4792 [Rhodofomes roseus]|uniref:Uncharacterized protein n=1 Tax=Rhodofomes roseus TaxID=34475 RepID=A0A4Y9YH05_9APHY|nr:hypothetical protein EVJ58_g4792 [Rhodofomes roseus]
MESASSPVLAKKARPDDRSVEKLDKGRALLTPPPSSPAQPASSPAGLESDNSENPSHVNLRTSSTLLQAIDGEVPTNPTGNDPSPSSAASAQPGGMPGTAELQPTIVTYCNAEWSDALQSRVKKIVLSSDNANHRFNIYDVPTTGNQWEKVGSENHIQYLCRDGQPLRFWIVGEATEAGVWLIGRNGQTPTNVAVRMRPVRVGEYEKWESFLNSLGGMKAKTPSAPGTLVGRRHMVYRSKHEMDSRPTPFNDCYDATQTLKPYASMSAWPTPEVGVNDLLMMEVRVTRWKCNAEGNAAYKTGWERYRGLGKARADNLTLAALRSWQVVPPAFEDLCEWGDVEADTTQPRSTGSGAPRSHYTLLWSPSLFDEGGQGVRRRALIRLHGFLGAFCIRPLGNWKGSADDAKKAVQYVMLTGHDQPAAFDPQLQTIGAIDNLVYRSLRMLQAPPERKPGVINLRRRVFTRVTPLAAPPQIPLSASDQDAVKAVQGQWRVSHHLSLGTQRRDGQIYGGAKDIIFAKGDFVEVAVFVDVVSYWDTKSRQRKVDIQYAPQEIIKLWSAKDAKVRDTQQQHDSSANENIRK